MSHSASIPEEPDAGQDGRDETITERLDRNWAELLQELRVIQTGTQILTGFLLAAVFQSRFDELDAFQRDTYLVLVVTSVLTTLVGLAPVSLHRALFRRQAKATIVRVTDYVDRAELEQAIIALRLKQDRMPAHWHERRQQVADEVDMLVDRWIAAAS